MKSSIWKKTKDNPECMPATQWAVELGDTVSITNEAGGWSVSLVAGQGVEEERRKQFGKRWYPTQAKDVLESDLKENGFTLFMEYSGLKKA